jgi:hypothetical protein
VRIPHSRVILAAVPVDLLMQVSRGDDNRLSGTIRLAHGPDAREFSGMLELIRAFEELVPFGEPSADAAGAVGRDDVAAGLGD